MIALIWSWVQFQKISIHLEVSNNKKSLTFLWGFFCTRDGSWTRTDITIHRILSPACLPVPPPGRVSVILTLNWHYFNCLYLSKIILNPKSILNKKTLSNERVFWAEDRARTGHPDLGKVVLYQMSYFRVIKNN